jgi:hypothetical protein
MREAKWWGWVTLVASGFIGSNACGGTQASNEPEGSDIGTGGAAEVSGAGGSDADGSTTGGEQATGGQAEAGALPTGGADTASSPPSAALDPCPGLPLTAAELACPDLAPFEPVPADLFFMVDRSMSMMEQSSEEGVSRWEDLLTAIRSFVTDPEVIEKQVRLGVNFFSQTGGFVADMDCSVDRYAAFGDGGVEAASLADSGHAQAILDTMDAVVLGGGTPTMPALQGALAYAKDFETRQDTGRSAAVVLITDGNPTQCQDPLSRPAVAAAAEEAYRDEPSVRTFVVAIGPALDGLDQVAEGGATREAFLFEQPDPNELLQAFKAIALSPLTCEFSPPEPPDVNTVVDLDGVLMRITPDPEVPDEVELVPRIQSAAECAQADHGGLYYDDPPAPQKIRVCPCTCARIGTGLVDMFYQCSDEGLL